MADQKPGFRFSNIKLTAQPIQREQQFTISKHTQEVTQRERDKQTHTR